MARIAPVTSSELLPDTQAAFNEHVQQYNARITNMKATLGHSLPSFQVYMQWYVLYDEIKKILGNRMASLFAYSISSASDCPLCTTFFRKIIVDNGEDPASLELTTREQKLLAFGSEISINRGHLKDETFNSLSSMFKTDELVTLIAFAGQMIATNIFSNVTQTDIDEYLLDYFKHDNPAK